MNPWHGAAPVRGEVWDANLEGGRHPGVILSVNSLNSRLGSLIIVVVTETAGPSATHVALSTEAGLTRYDESYANVTDLHSVS